MDIKQGSDIINSIEEKFPVDEWVIDGIHVWPIIRMKLAFELTGYYTTSAQNKKSLFKKIIIQLKGYTRFLYAYIRDYSKNAKLNRHIDVIFLSNGVSYTNLNGAWYDILCDPFISHFNDANRSEERRVGKECRSRWSPYH